MIDDVPHGFHLYSLYHIFCICAIGIVNKLAPPPIYAHCTRTGRPAPSCLLPVGKSGGLLPGCSPLRRKARRAGLPSSSLTGTTKGAARFLCGALGAEKKSLTVRHGSQESGTRGRSMEVSLPAPEAVLSVFDSSGLQEPQGEYPFSCRSRSVPVYSSRFSALMVLQEAQSGR